VAGSMCADRVSRKAGQLEQTLVLFGRLSSEAGNLLMHLSQQMEELTSHTAPIHERAAALSTAQLNVDATKASVDRLLDSLDVSRRVSNQMCWPGTFVGNI